MPRIKARRKYKLIAFKAYYDEDEDILEWWEGIPDGERSGFIRDVVRQYLDLPTKRRKKLIIPELTEVRRDTVWIRDTLNDLPAYLDRLIKDVVEAAGNRPVIVQSSARASPQDTQDDGSGLTQAETERRSRRMQNATW